jgi:eukaryotic-like serine/threonine-protein kinase
MIGSTIGHFNITRKIGQGGMGVVYLARDERLERDVALKVLREGLFTDESARRRFRKEALALSKLNHPNIALIYDFDSQGGVDFLVMEYVTGTSLAQRLEGGALPEREIVSIATQIAQALDEAHDHGVIHRDLKPGNILLTAKGRVKVLDFGLARFLRSSDDLEATESITQTHTLTGTLPYMAPEQLQGEVADARSDIHAAGAVLFEMATGQRAFREELSSRLIDAILNHPPISPRAVNRKVSTELERIILKCLEKDRENRYQSARELEVDLRRLTAGSITASVYPAKATNRSSLRKALIAGLGAVLLVAILVGFNVGGSRDRLLGRVHSPQIRSLAVLPLENLSRDPDQEYFADGMTDAIITDLAKVGALRVISRTSVMRYKRSQKSVPEIAKELNVEAVMEGSIERSGDRVRISAQLIQAATDQHMWAEAYDRDLHDVLRVQEEIARSIAQEVQIQLTPQEQALLTKARPVDPEAYELYLKGRYFWNKRTRESNDKAIALFQQAIARDPAYPSPYSGLADCYILFAISFDVGSLSPTEAIPQAKAAAEKAVQLDDTLADGHNSLAYTKLLYDWDWAGSEAEFKRALQLNPGYANAHHWYAHLLLASGRQEEALAESRRALDLDQLSPILQVHLGWHYIYTREYDRALDQLRKALELDPNYSLAHWYLGWVYEQQGKYAEALQALRKAQDFLPSNSALVADIGHVYAMSGNTRAAMKVLAQLDESSKRTYVNPFEVSLIYLALGRRHEALQWLERAYRERSDLLIYLNADPRLDSIRSDPQFVDLARRVGLLH